MSPNARYLAILWVVVGAIFAFVASLYARSVVDGDYVMVAAGVVGVGILVVALGCRARRRLRQLLQCETPVPLVQFYERTMGSTLIPNGDALLSHSSALAYTLYADYPAARAALARVAWNERPPLVRALRRSVEALLCYFDTQEYARGLDLAESAKELAAIPALFPGARTAAAAHESYGEIGQVLCGKSTEATVASLERKMASLPLIGRLLVAWGLAIAYSQRGNTAKAEDMLAFVRKYAPHCRAVTSMPTVTVA
jgi:hypothetical protein